MKLLKTSINKLERARLYNIKSIELMNEFIADIEKILGADELETIDCCIGSSSNLLELISCHVGYNEECLEEIKEVIEKFKKKEKGKVEKLKCQHCNNEKAFYVKKSYKGEYNYYFEGYKGKYNFYFDSEGKGIDNIGMFGESKYSSKFIYCSECDKKVKKIEEFEPWKD